MPEGTVCFTALYTASLTSNSLTCFLIYSANSYGVANNIYIVLFGRQSTTIYLILLQSACFRAQSEHGQQPALVDDCGFCFFFCTCEQRYPQLGLAYLGRNLGQVGRRVAMGAALGQSFLGTEEVGIIY